MNGAQKEDLELKKNVGVLLYEIISSYFQLLSVKVVFISYIYPGMLSFSLFNWLNFFKFGNSNSLVGLWVGWYFPPDIHHSFQWNNKFSYIIYGLNYDCLKKEYDLFLHTYILSDIFDI